MSLMQNPFLRRLKEAASSKEIEAKLAAAKKAYAAKRDENAKKFPGLGETRKWFHSPEMVRLWDNVLELEKELKLARAREKQLKEAGGLDDLPKGSGPLREADPAWQRLQMELLAAAKEVSRLEAESKKIDGQLAAAKAKHAKLSSAAAKARQSAKEAADPPTPHG